MTKKQIKIPRTYRLPESTLEGIEKIRESFLKDNMELSSDSAVISYAVGAALGLCKEVDKGYKPVYLNEEEIRIILNWFRTSQEESPELFQKSLKIKDRLKWELE